MAGRVRPLKLVLQGVDRASGVISKFNRKLERLNAPVSNLSKQLAKLSKNLKLPQLRSALGGVGSELGRLAKRAAFFGGIVGGAAVAGMRALINYGDEVGATASKLDVTTGALQRARYAGEQLDVETATMDAGLSRLNKNMGEAARKRGPMRSLLESMGVDVAKVGDPLDALAIMVEKVKNLPREVQADKFGRAFGRGVGADMLNLVTKEGAAKLKALYAEADATGSVMGDDGVQNAGELDNALRKMMRTVRGLGIAIGSELMPDVLEIVRGMQDWLDKYRDTIKVEIIAHVRALRTWVKDTWPQVLKLAEAMGGWKTVAVAVGLVLAGPLLGALATLALTLTNLGIVVIPLIASALVGLDFAMLLNPIGLTIAAVVALGALGTWLYMKYEPFRKLVHDVMWLLSYTPTGYMISKIAERYTSSGAAPGDAGGMSMASGGAGDASQYTAAAQALMGQIAIDLSLPKGASGRVTSMKSTPGVDLNMGMSMAPGF